MRKKWFVGAALCFSGVFIFSGQGRTQSGGEIEELRQRVEQQRRIIDLQQKTIEEIMQRMAVLEDRQSPAGAGADASPRVNLQEEEIASLSSAAESTHVLERPWYQNFHLDGFGAGGLLWTGGEALEQHTGFLNYEATIHVDAKVWEDVHYFHELQTIRMGDENTKFVRTGEAHVHLKDVFQTLFGREGMNVGAKIGRMDIPFGEDYLVQDVVDNPLITFAAAYPYGYDEGLVLYGKIKEAGWIAAVMDGIDSRAAEDSNDKFLSVKLYGNPTERLYLSGSLMRAGQTSESAWEFGGSHMVPVGAGSLTSALGRSGSGTINAYSYEFDARYSLGHDRYLKTQAGYALIDDDIEEFDRDIYYFQVEPKWNLGPRFDNKWYLVSRFSAIGTFNDDKGYAFDGKPFAGGKSAFGFDAKALYRYAFGLGFAPNPRTLIKMEYSVDDFQLIDASSKDGGSDGRDFIGIITAVKF